MLLSDELVGVLPQAGHLLLLLAHQVLESVMRLEVRFHLLNGRAALCVAEGNLLGGGGGQDLLDVPQVEMDIDQLVQVDLLVLPGSVQLLPLGQDRLDLALHLALGAVAFGDHGFSKSNHLAECLLPGLYFRFQIVMLRLQHLGGGSVRDLLLCDETPPEPGAPGQQVPHHAGEGVVVAGGEEGGLPLARPLLQLPPGGQHLLLGRQHLLCPIPGVAGLQGGAVVDQHLQLGLQSDQVVLEALVPPDVALGRLGVLASVLRLKDGALFLDPAQGLRDVTVEPVDLARRLKRPVLLLDLVDEVPPLLGQLGLYAAHLLSVVRGLEPLGQGVADGELVLAGLHPQLELLEPGQQELPVLVVSPCVDGARRPQLQPDPGQELARLPHVLVQLDCHHQTVPPRLRLLLQVLHLPAEPLGPGLDQLALRVLAVHQLVGGAGHLLDDAAVRVDLQLQRLVFGQQLHRAVLVLAKVAAVQRLVLVPNPALHLGHLKEVLLGLQQGCQDGALLLGGGQEAGPGLREGGSVSHYLLAILGVLQQLGSALDHLVNDDLMVLHLLLQLPVLLAEALSLLKAGDLHRGRHYRPLLSQPLHLSGKVEVEFMELHRLHEGLFPRLSGVLHVGHGAPHIGTVAEDAVAVEVALGEVAGHGAQVSHLLLHGGEFGLGGGVLRDKLLAAPHVVPGVLGGDHVLDVAKLGLQVRGHSVIVVLRLGLAKLGALLPHGCDQVVPQLVHFLQLGSDVLGLEVVPLDHLLACPHQHLQLPRVGLDLALHHLVLLGLRFHLPDAVSEGVFSDQAPLVGDKIFHLVDLGPEVLVELCLLQQGALLPAGGLEGLPASQHLGLALADGVGAEVLGGDEAVGHLHQPGDPLLLCCQSGGEVLVPLQHRLHVFKVVADVNILEELVLGGGGCVHLVCLPVEELQVPDLPEVVALLLPAPKHGLPVLAQLVHLLLRLLPRLPGVHLLAERDQGVELVLLGPDLVTDLSVLVQ